MKQAMNPILPFNTYIPDVEPHVFGDRVYLYGSHDKENGDEFCMLPYECWSAPVNDLIDWRCEGISYTSEHDPHATEKRHHMYAPDCVQGNDGKYYLYYCLQGYGENYNQEGIISVAVCDTPDGKFEYLGDVRTPNGKPYQHFCMFDPGVMNDNGKIYLYYGAGSMKMFSKLPGFITNKIFKMMHGLTYKEMSSGEYAAATYLGANVVELEDDMLTIKGEARRIIPDEMEARRKKDKDFIGHGFFEAASIRKFNDTYYFIYSNSSSHQLAYCTSKYPDRDFKYQGLLISNGDIGYQGRGEDKQTRPVGNNHGSIEYINGRYYIFYHIHTNKTSYSRQVCAEEISMDENGLFHMVECTSCGINGKPLAPEGTYSATICCVLKGKDKPLKGFSSFRGKAVNNPYISCADGERLIKDIADKSIIGYKYFDFAGETKVKCLLRGRFKGAISICNDEACTNIWTKKEVDINADEWKYEELTFSVIGKNALYISFIGEGNLAMKEIMF